jgi:hypothetical protein
MDSERELKSQECAQMLESLLEQTKNEIALTSNFVDEILHMNNSKTSRPTNALQSRFHTFFTEDSAVPMQEIFIYL